ncbi:hypothetical protein Rhopal_005258-T1 [Rhodotorula paludigena]|uniref:Protein-serine/threonine kinase n=1 Tax=Rhodotorula paludigena TaxID=86838 RepID=A0AAV5GUF0_9BASI|nr:hypothetical protein Rhopal_005258-T1 [Rhodotorula paludigena]
MQAMPRKSQVPAFFLNRIIEQYAQKSSTPISLKHMINFGNAGRNKGEKEEAEKLIKGGNFELPYAVASHPRMQHVYDLYLEAFEEIRKFPHIADLDGNDRFCQFMTSTLHKHRVIIPELAIGVSETSPVHLPATALDRIMLRMLRSRISRRVITEQHIALTQQFRERQDKGKGKQRAADDGEEERYVGIVDTRLNAADMVRRCAELIRALGGPAGEVPIVLEGDVDHTFAYISEHLEFMLFELIKNAAYATVSAHGAAAKDHPTLVTLVHSARDLVIRVSDQGGGIPPYGGLPPDPADVAFSPLLSTNTLAAPLSAQRLDIFSFSHMRRHYQHQAATAAAAALAASAPSPAAALEAPPASSPGEEAADPSGAATGIMALRSVGELTGTVEEQISRHQRLGDAGDERELMDAQVRSGIGLPLAKMYAAYFDGSLDIFTLQGYGSDAVLKVPKFGIEGAFPSHSF